MYGLVVLLFESKFFKTYISNFIYLGVIGFLVNLIVTALLLWRIITYYLPIAVGGIVIISDGGT
jgi:hypothetical protein